MEDKIINKVITRFETQGYQEAMEEIKSVANAQEQLSVATKPLGWAKTRGHVYSNMRAMRYLEKPSQSLSAFGKSDLAKSASFRKSLEKYVTQNVQSSIQSRLKDFNPSMSAFRSDEVFKSDGFKKSLTEYVTQNVQSSLQSRLKDFNPSMSAFQSDEMFKSDSFKQSLNEYVVQNVQSSISGRLKDFNPNFSAFQSDEMFKSDGFKQSLNKYVTQNVRSSINGRLQDFNPDFSAFKSDDVLRSPAFQRSMEEYVIDNIGRSLEARYSDFNPRASAFKSDKLSKSPAFKKSLEDYVVKNIQSSINQRLSSFSPEKSAFNSSEFTKTPEFKKQIESTVLDNIARSMDSRMAFDPKKSAFSGKFRRDLGEKELDDQLRKYEGVLNRVTSFQKQKLDTDTREEEARKALRARVLGNITSEKEIRAGAAHSRAITALKRERISESYGRRVNLKKFQQSYGDIAGIRAGLALRKSSMNTYRHLNKLNSANQRYNHTLKTERRLKSSLAKGKTGARKGGMKTRFGGGANALASRAMLWMGLASLTSYVGGGLADKAMQLGDAISSTEIDILKGKGYRSHYGEKYGSTQGFDEAARYHSRVSGEAEYMGRSRIAIIAGGLEASNINITPKRLKDIVTAAQGISILKNTDFEGAYEGVIGILTKRRTPEEEKLVGLKGGGSPEQLLDKILDHLRNNPTTAGILGKATLKATMQSIRSAPSAMLADVYAERPTQARRGFETIGKRWGEIFSTDTEEKLTAWTSVLESWNQVMESFDLQSNKALMLFIEGSVATISFALQSLGFFLSNFDKFFMPAFPKWMKLFANMDKENMKSMPPLNTSGYTLTPKQTIPTIVSAPGGYENFNSSTRGSTGYNTFKVDSMTVSDNAITNAAIMTQIS